MKTFNEKGILDYIGATISWICAVHCLAMPLLITMLPLIGLSFLADETTEWILIGLSMAFALISLLPAYFKQHRKIRTILLFAFGIGLILLSHLVFEDELVWNIPLVLSGAALITSAHFINRHLCRDCKNCQDYKLVQNAVHTSFSAIH